MKEQTGGGQQPWLASSPIAGNFYFINGPVTVTVQPPAGGDAARPRSTRTLCSGSRSPPATIPPTFAPISRIFRRGVSPNSRNAASLCSTAPVEAPKRTLLPGMMFGAAMNEALPRNRFPYSALHIASEYRREEVRYLVLNMRELPEWREFLAFAGCLSPDSYVAFLFRDAVLFRASVRLHVDAACSDYGATLAKLRTLPHASDIKTFDRSAHGFTIFEFIKPGVASSDGDLW